MNTTPLSLFTVFDNGLGGLTWQEWVDRYEEKFNELNVDGFSFAPTSINYTFAQLIASVGATALPTWVDPESPGYEAALKSISGRTGNIPTAKRYYRFNRTIINEQLQLLSRVGNAALTPEMQDIFMGLVDEGTDGLIQSYRNALTHIRHRVISTGKFDINSVNNPRGLQGISIEFGVAAPDELTGTKRWFTAADHSAEGSASDPIQYMKDRVKYIRRTKHYVGGLKMEIGRDLWEDLLTHSKVIAKLAAYFYPNASSPEIAANNVKVMDDSAFMEAIRKMIKVDEIVVRETYAYVDAPGTDENGDPDLITTRVDNFDPQNIVFLPTGNLGNIQGVAPLAIGYEQDKVARFDGDRLLLTQRANPKTHSVYIESEFAQLCVPSVPQWIFVSKVSA